MENATVMRRIGKSRTKDINTQSEKKKHRLDTESHKQMTVWETNKIKINICLGQLKTREHNV